MPLPTSSQNSAKASRQPQAKVQPKPEEEFSLPSIEELPSLQELNHNSSAARGIPSSKPVVESTPAPVANEILDSNGVDAHGMKTDPATGIKYRVIPKSEYDAEGFPILQIPDFNADDLNSEAESFLGHLRVAPSKEELLRLREERATRLSAARALENNSNLQQEENDNG